MPIVNQSPPPEVDTLVEVLDDLTPEQDSNEVHLRNSLISLSLSLLMAAIIQAINSIGNFFQDIFYTLHWDVEPN